MGTTKRGFFNIIFGVIEQIVIIVFAFVTPKLVIENYGSEINGLLHSFAQIFTYFSLFEAGVGSASLQALYAPVANKDEKRISGIMSATRIFYTRAGLLYAGGVVCVALLYPLVVHVSLPYYYVAAIILFGGIGGCVNFIYQGKYILLMQAEGYTYVSTSINTLCNIFTNVAKVALLLCGYNVLAVQISVFAVSLIRAFLYHLYIRKHYGSLDIHAVPDLDAISQKNHVLVHQISYLVFSSTDVLLLTFLTQDLKVVSVYTLYNSIVSTFFTLVSQVSNGFDFYLGQTYAVDREKYYKVYHVFEIIHLVIIFAVMSTVYLVLPPFMKLYMKNVTDISYYNRLYPLLFVLVPLLTHGRTAASSTILFAGHFKNTQKYAIYETVINLAVTFFGVIYLGIPGALLGTIIASVFRTTNIIWYVYKNLIPGSPWLSVKKWIACLGIFAALAWINFIHPIDLGSYFQIVVFAAITGCLLLCIFGGCQYIINKNERAMIKSVLKETVYKAITNKLKAGKRNEEQG